MILGIGTDLVRIDRIARALDRFGERFAQRILAPEEVQNCTAAPDASRFLAKRFAAKEAAAKALGRGLSGGISWHDFTISHDARGAPALHLQGRAAEIAEDLGVGAIHLSISDESEHAIAFVVIESRVGAGPD